MTAREEPENEAELAAMQSAAGEDAFDTAWRRGQAMDLDQAIDFVLNY